MVVMRVWIKLGRALGDFVKRLVAGIALCRFDGCTGLRRLDAVAGFAGDAAFDVTVSSLHCSKASCRE